MKYFDNALRKISRVPSKKTIGWLAFLFFSLIYASTKFSTDYPTLFLGSFFGRIIVFAAKVGILAFLVAGIYWLFKRKRMPNIGYSVFIIALFLMAMSVISAISEVWFPSEDLQSIDTQSKNPVYLEKMESFAQTVKEKERKIKNDYIQNLKEIDWENLLSPTRLASDPDLTETNSMMDDARSATDQYIRQTIEYFIWVDKEAASLELGSLKEPFLASFQERLKSTMPLVKRNLDIEWQVMEVTGELISLLNDPTDLWEVSDGMILFSSDEDLEEFNQGMTEVNKLGEEQTTIINVLRQSIKD
jgi:hypothetical protein